MFASSYLIYDPALYNFAEVPAQPRSLRETDPILPRNLTGMAKLAHEIELRFLDTFRASSSARSPRASTGATAATGATSPRAGCGCCWPARKSRCMAPSRFSTTSTPPIRPRACCAWPPPKAVTGIINLGTGQARRVADVVDVLRQNFPGYAGQLRGLRHSF